MAIEKFTNIKVDNFEDYNAEIHRITIESIQLALLQLLENQSYENISIKEIVAKAGVSRSAFYRNYKSKEEVVESLIYDSLNRKFSQVYEEIENEKQHGDANFKEQWITIIKEMFLENHVVYRLIQSKACQGNDILRCMNRCFSQTFDEMQDDYEWIRYTYMIGGIYNLLLSRLDSGREISFQKIAEVIMAFYE